LIFVETFPKLTSRNPNKPPNNAISFKAVMEDFCTWLRSHGFEPELVRGGKLLVMNVEMIY
jgi:hypothetical protein